MLPFTLLPFRSAWFGISLSLLPSVRSGRANFTLNAQAPLLSAKIDAPTAPSTAHHVMLVLRRCSICSERCAFCGARAITTLLQQCRSLLWVTTCPLRPLGLYPPVRSLGPHCFILFPRSCPPSLAFYALLPLFLVGSLSDHSTFCRGRTSLSLSAVSLAATRFACSAMVLLCSHSFTALVLTLLLLGGIAHSSPSSGVLLFVHEISISANAFTPGPSASFAGELLLSSGYAASGPVVTDITRPLIARESGLLFSAQAI